MLKRIIGAIAIISIFVLLATKTPLKFFIFNEKGNIPDPYEKIDVLNQIQILNSKKATEEALKHAKETEGRKPVHLEIPSIKVSASIFGVGLTKTGTMDTLKGPTSIAWYKYGAIPGEKGNAILAGHRDWNGVLGSLYNLEKMKIGDKLTITYEKGHKRIFKLVSNRIYLINEIPKEAMSLEGDTRVTIITCAGKYDSKTQLYDSRAIAVFKKLD